MNATRSKPPNRFPWHTWVGLAIIVLGEAALAGGVGWIATWLTPIQWTGYILLADGVVCRLTGGSWLTSDTREFPLLVLISVGVWLLFEAYNFRLRNWLYEGVPSNAWIRGLAYFWSFATILPGVFETADMLGAVLGRRRLTIGWPQARPRPVSWIVPLAGAAMVLLPLVVPQTAASYLFGFVWIGFALILDPVNARLGGPSLLARCRQGDWRPVLGLLAGGLVCGFVWETWNYQAYLAQGAFWVYTIPEPLRVLGWHYGQMPVLGLLGFPPFAIELFAFYHLARRLLGGDRVFRHAALPARVNPDG